MRSGRAAFERNRAAVEIGLARIHGGIADDRNRLRLQLDAIRPSAVGVPERALLIVPRLVARKPLPRQGDGGLFAGSVVDELRAALKRARRPGEPHSPHDSLLFLDELEGAVCLIEQWLAGVPPARRTWWPHFTAGVAPPIWWRRHVLPDARILPRLIAALARRNLAEAWLRRLEPEDVRTAVAAIAAGVGLSIRIPPPPAPRPAADDPGAATPETAEAAALIDAIVPEVRRADLPPPACLLLLLALLAERRPAMVTTRAAKAAFAAAASGTLSTLLRPAPRPRPVPPAPHRKRRPPGPELGHHAARARAPEPRTARPPVGKAAETALAAIEARPPPEPAARRATAGRRHGAAIVEAAPVPIEAATEYGGLLFLLNALLALGLYGDFSRPERALPGLSPFGLLRLLGRAWFGRPFVEDPLHGLLVRLAGGSRADAARDFEAPFWSVPPDWLSPWPQAGPARIGAPRRGPMLWHPAGFPLAQLDPAAPLTRARWIACLRLYLEARLARTLACRDRAGAVAMLCRRPARVAADEEDVAVTFALDGHPIAIRLAGLDRDPGWIPAARRSIRYLFQ